MSNNGKKNEIPIKKPLPALIKEQISAIIAIATFIGVIFGGYFWLDDRYARAEDLAQLNERFELKLAQLNQRFELKLKEDIRAQTQERIWKLEDRLKQQPNDTTANEELRQLIDQKNILDKEIEILKQPPKK